MPFELIELFPEPIQGAILKTAAGLTGAALEMGAQEGAKALLVSLRGGERRAVERAFAGAIATTLQEYPTLQDVGFARWLGQSPACDAFLEVLAAPVLEPDPAAMARLLEPTEFDLSTADVSFPLLVESLRANFLAALHRNQETRLLFMTLLQQQQGEEHRAMLRLQSLGMAMLERIEAVLAARASGAARKRKDRYPAFDASSDVLAKFTRQFQHAYRQQPALGMDELGEWISAWFERHGTALDARERYAILHGVEHDLLERARAAGLTPPAVLRWRLRLLARVLSHCSLDDRGWPQPIQLRVSSVYTSEEQRILDYTLLYEVLIHFHFVVLASQFLTVADALAEEELPREAAGAVDTGYRILHQVLHDAAAPDSRAWLHRAGGLSHVLHALREHGRPALGELVDLLDPARLRLHEPDGTAADTAFAVSGGAIFGIFEFLNEMHGCFADGVGDLAQDDPIAQEGVRRVLGLASICFAPYRELGVAEVSAADTNLHLAAQWSEDGKRFSATNREARDRHFVPLWGAPPTAEAPFLPPEPPSLAGWQPGWWDDSLLLFDREKPRREWLYLMPWAFSSLRNGDVQPSPSLLERVDWQSHPSQGRPPVLSPRWYHDAREERAGGSADGADGQESHAAARNSVRAIVGRIQALQARLHDAAPPEPALEPPRPVSAGRTFELGYAQRALQISADTFQRAGEVERLLEAAKAEAQSPYGVCGLVAVLGQSGSGKSVLMAQAFTRVRERALFLAMDSPPAPEYEPAAPEPARRARGAGLDAVEGEGGLVPGPDPVPGIAGLGGHTESTPAATIAVPVRMHWLAGACRLAGEAPPRQPLSAPEVSQRITHLLRTVPDAAGEPLYIFIDAVNQADTPETLLSGLLPLNRLPGGVVVIVSTQENEMVTNRLDVEGKWRAVRVAPLSSDETIAVMREGWEDEPAFPELDAELRTLLHQKVSGLPILARHWGERLREMVAGAPDVPAELRRFRGELENARTGAIPREYLTRLVAELGRDFVPAQLPSALVWCFAIVEGAVDREALFAAQPVLRAEFTGLPEVTRADIDAALARLGGFLGQERMAGARRWRLAHPSLGEAWLREYGTADRVGRLNAALLPFGATPRVDDWSASTCEEWLVLATERSARYDRLTLDQREILLQGLLRRLGADPGVRHLRHRRLALRRQQASLLFDRGELEESGKLARSVYQEMQRWKLDEASPEVRADLLFDLGNAAAMAGWFAWNDKQPEHVELYETAVRLQQEAAALSGERWSTLRGARLVRAHLNIAVNRGNADDGAGALDALDRALALGATLDAGAPEVLEELADGHGSRAWHLSALGRSEEALAAYDEAVAFYEREAAEAPERREQFANTLFNRGVGRFGAGRYAEAAADYSRAIALYHDLQGRGDAREMLSHAYAYRADSESGLGQLAAAARDYREAAALAASLEQTPERQGQVARLYNRAADCLRQAGRLDEAVDVHSAAIDFLGARSAGDARTHAALRYAYRERAAIQREAGRAEEALAAYVAAPEPVLLGNGDFGVVFDSPALEPGDGVRPVAQVSDGAAFLRFHPLPAEHQEWALERLGLARAELGALRGRMVFRVAPLSFYADGYLLVAEDPARSGFREAFALCRLGGEVYPMDWTNGPIYEANAGWGIELDQEAQVKDYCRFFFHFVYGRHGKFQLFDDVAELPWLDEAGEAGEADRERVRAIASPLAMLPPLEPDVYRVSSRMLFKDAIFSADLHVVHGTAAPERRGLVSLAEEVLLDEGLPVHLPPRPMLRDEPAPVRAEPLADDAAQHLPRESALVRYRTAPERMLLQNSQFGVLLHRLLPDDPAQEPLPSIRGEAAFLSFEPLPEQHLEWARERMGLTGMEFELIRPRVAFYVAPLAFYDDGWLLAAEDTSRRGRRETFALCRLGGEVIGLDWTNAPIYQQANTNWGIRLETPEQVIQYARFFFHFVHGRHGGFHIFDEARELPWTAAATEGDLAAVSAVCSPLALVPSTVPGTHQLHARILFKGAVFSATVRVDLGSTDSASRGQVGLADETILLDELPVHLPPPPFIRDIPPPPPAPVETGVREGPLARFARFCGNVYRAIRHRLS